MSKRVYLVLGVIAILIGSTMPAADAYTGAFLSRPRQAAPLKIHGGTNVIVANKSWIGFRGQTCLTVENARNVYIHDVDFESCGGGIFLVNVRGNIRIENVRARNTGNGSIGSGHGNVIQLNNSWQGSPSTTTTAGIRYVKAYGGDTEDAISIYKSGGLDARHPLLIEGVHIEHPLTGTLAWSSQSGTCINLADGGGHDITLRYSTFLNCGAVGIQMNEPGRNVKVRNNTVYGQRRPTSNVGLSQWSSGTCGSSCPGNEFRGNRVYWVKENATANPMWLSHRFPVADLSNYKQQPHIDITTLYVRFT
jgi:hypothetical protein